MLRQRRHVDGEDEDQFAKQPLLNRNNNRADDKSGKNDDKDDKDGNNDDIIMKMIIMMKMMMTELIWRRIHLMLNYNMIIYYKDVDMILIE